MDFLASGVILIKAINTMGYPIAKLKDYLQLSITINDESIIISCSEERSGGIYAFNINDISPFARVFVCLKQSILLDTSMISDDKLNLCNITQYLSQMPYFLHPDCKQINLVGTMCNASKPIPFTFIVSPKAINIGIIKAYKKDNITKNFINDISGISNPKNEIYTMDLNQEINLKAFVYERQKTYLASKDITDTNTQIAYNNSLQKGNITKNITSITPLESANIKWAFKIVNGSYKADSNARSEAFIKLGEKQPLSIVNKADDKNNTANNPTNTTKDNINKLDSIPDDKSYVVLEHLQGDSVTIKLSDIFTSTALESLVNKNIIFFAYDANVGIKADADTNINAYRTYQDNNNPNARIIYQDKITSIELKILKTRFRLEFDGEYLFFYENEREIKSFPCKRLYGDKEQSISLFVDLLPQTLRNHHIDLLDKESELISLLQAYSIQAIPLKIAYQKRILIMIERFKQTTESTTARMNIYIDRKKVDSNGKMTNEDLSLESLPKNNPYAFILERPSPDSIGGGLKLRIPEGRYKVKWHNGKARKDNLKLHNEFVGFQRAILIHEGYTMKNTKGQAQGTSPRNTFGCLVIARDMVKKNGTSNDFIDNVLQPDSTKKQELTNAIKPNGFLNSHLAKSLNKKQVSIKEVMDNIEIRVKNSFERNQISISPISLTFNGQFLAILINGEQKHSFQAVSGRPQEIDGKHYFTYEKERQMLENEGAIPEGEYYIDIGKISKVPSYRLDRRYSWGDKNVPIELNKQETYGRYGFYIHGGWSAGSAGCIDLWDKNELFFETLIEWSQKFNTTKIPLKVEYDNAVMECSSNLLGMIKQCEAK